MKAKSLWMGFSLFWRHAADDPPRPDDLTDLVECGQLERVCGGAILPSNTMNIGYSERHALNQSTKVDIARICARQIPNNCSLFLKIGTSNEAVAAELLNQEWLLVVTNNINIASILSVSSEIEVAVTGGSCVVRTVD